MKWNCIFICFSFFLHSSLSGQAGSPDTDFGVEGIVITDISGDHDIAHALAIQSDGKILAAGESFSGYDNDFCIVRYDPDGTLDASFGNSGITLTNIGEDDNAYAIAIQPDGKILLAGESIYDDYTYIAVTRYTTNGILDSTFSDDGILIPEIVTEDGTATSVVVTADFKIYVAGYISSGNLDIFLMCFDADGNPVTSFGTDGQVISDFGGDQGGLAMALQNDHKIVIGGWDLNANSDFAILRYNEDGTPDSTFNSDGYFVTPFTPNTDGCRAVGIQNDGKIIAAGFRWEEEDGDDFALLRLDPDGSTDASFGSLGKVTTDFQEHNDQAFALALQGDGKIIVAGYTVSLTGYGYDYAVARYFSNGDLDPSFGDEGKVITSLGNYFEHANAMVLQPDGKILVAGDSYTDNYDFALVRYLNDYTGIEDSVMQEDQNFTCFPNPFDDHFTLTVNDQGYGPGFLKIFDLLGNEILHQQIELRETEINLSGYANGVYLIRYENEFNLFGAQIVKR